MKARTIVLVVLLASMSLVVPRQLSVSATDTSNSRGIWSFDEGMGNLAHDTSGNANDGTILGGATWADGRVGKALSLDGSSGYVEVPDSDSLDVTGKLTLEAWICPRSLNVRQVIVCKYNHTSLSSSYYLGVGGALGAVLYLNKIYYGLTYDGNHYYAMVSNANLTINTWTHVAAVSNVTHMSIYINGVLDIVRTYPPGNIYAGSAKLRIGCYLPETEYGRFFDGALDEVRVAAGVIWTVDDDKVQCPNADFTAIQPAVNAASSGDTIFVHEGTYYESQIVVGKSLTVRGSDADTTIVDGGDAELTEVGLVRVNATAGDVTISDLTMRNAGGPPIVKEYGTFKVRVGIYAASASVGLTYTFVRNKIYGTNNDIEEEDYGLYSSGGKDSLIFTQNTITQTGSNAILLERHTGPTDISHNTLDAGVWGIDVIFTMTYGGDDITTLQRRNYNDVDLGTGGPYGSDHRATGITFASSYAGGGGDGKFTNLQIEGNTIRNVDSYRRGISLWNGATGDGSAGNIVSPRIICNKIEGDSASANSFGIRFIGLVTDATVIGNNVTGTPVGISVTDAPGAIVSFNYIYDNTEYGLLNSGTTVVNATHNWWGNETGPHHGTSWTYMGSPYGPHLGEGGNVSDYVLYDPWLEHGTPTLEIKPSSPVCRIYAESYTVGVEVADAYNVTGLQFEIRFNTTLLNCTGVVWDAWGSGTASVNEGTGVVTGSTQGVIKTGTTKLVTFSFDASYYHIWKDESTIVGWKNNLTGGAYFEWAELSFSGTPSLRYERDGQHEIEADPVEVAYTFSPMKGDLNNDGDVEIADLVTICHYYDVDEGDGLWSEAQAWDLVHFSGPKIIDIFDVIIISSNYGHEYTPPP